MSDVTQILNAIEQGDPKAAEDLLPLVYNELRVLAVQRLEPNKDPEQWKDVFLKLGSGLFGIGVDDHLREFCPPIPHDSWTNLKTTEQYGRAIIRIAIDHAEGKILFQRASSSKEDRTRGSFMMLNEGQIKDILENLLIVDADTLARFLEELQTTVDTCLGNQSASGSTECQKMEKVKSVVRPVRIYTARLENTKSMPGISTRLTELLFKYSSPTAFEIRRANNAEYLRWNKSHDETLNAQRRFPKTISDSMVANEKDYLQQCERIANAGESELWELHELLNAIRPDLALEFYTAVYRRDSWTSLQCADIVASIHKQLLDPRNGVDTNTDISADKTDREASNVAEKPATSLTRQADERALKNIEKDINHWLFYYVKTFRDVDQMPGRMYAPMTDEEVHAFVAANYRELWAKVPDHLKQSHREVQSRVYENLTESARGVTGSQGFAEWAGGDRVTLAIVFTDVVGSTALGEELKDDRMNEVRRSHFEQSRRLIDQFKGREIKTIGDSFMAAFRSVEQALDYAMALQANTGHPQVQIRADIHIGPMKVEENDAFGGTVNFAARVVGKIEGAEIWLSDRAMDDLNRSGGRQHSNLKWQRHDEVQLKGFDDKVTLWSLCGQIDGNVFLSSAASDDNIVGSLPKTSRVMEHTHPASATPTIVQHLKLLSRDWLRLYQQDVNKFLCHPIRGLCRQIGKSTSINSNDIEWVALYIDVPLKLTETKEQGEPPRYDIRLDPDLEGFLPTYVNQAGLGYLNLIYNELQKCDEGCRFRVPCMFFLLGFVPSFRSGKMLAKCSREET